MTRAEIDKLLASLLELTSENGKHLKTILEQQAKRKHRLFKYENRQINYEERLAKQEEWKINFEKQQAAFKARCEKWKTQNEKRRNALVSMYKEGMAKYEQLIADASTTSEDWRQQINKHVEFLMLDHAQIEANIGDFKELQIIMQERAEADRAEVRDYMERLISSQERLESVSSKLSRLIINMDKRLKKLETPEKA